MSSTMEDSVVALGIIHFVNKSRGYGFINARLTKVNERGTVYERFFFRLSSVDNSGDYRIGERVVVRSAKDGRQGFHKREATSVSKYVNDTHIFDLRNESTSRAALMDKAENDAYGGHTLRYGVEPLAADVHFITDRPHVHIWDKLYSNAGRWSIPPKVPDDIQDQGNDNGVGMDNSEGNGKGDDGELESQVRRLNFLRDLDDDRAYYLDMFGSKYMLSELCRRGHLHNPGSEMRIDVGEVVGLEDRMDLEWYESSVALQIGNLQHHCEFVPDWVNVGIGDDGSVEYKDLHGDDSDVGNKLDTIREFDMKYWDHMEKYESAAARITVWIDWRVRVRQGRRWREGEIYRRAELEKIRLHNDLFLHNGLQKRKREIEAGDLQEAKRRHAAMEAPSFDWFLTFTCNQAQHPRIKRPHEQEDIQETRHKAANMIAYNYLTRCFMKRRDIKSDTEIADSNEGDHEDLLSDDDISIF